MNSGRCSQTLWPISTAGYYTSVHREVPSAWILRYDLNPSFGFFPFRESFLLKPVNEALVEGGGKMSVPPVSGVLFG